MQVQHEQHEQQEQHEQHEQHEQREQQEQHEQDENSPLSFLQSTYQGVQTRAQGNSATTACIASIVCQVWCQIDKQD